jgi:hypothetical protein
MATVSLGMNGDARSVVLVARHPDSDVIEHMDPEAARKLAVTLMSAAGRAERSSAAPNWP